MRNGKIPDNVIRRLPRYLRYFQTLLDEGVSCASSTEIAAAMGTNASQVRQDFNLFGEFGYKGAGYEVKRVRGEFARLLGLDGRHTAVLAGVGNVGRTILEHFGAEEVGYTIAAGFDTEGECALREINGVPILPFEALPGYLDSHAADLIILACADTDAQNTADIAMAHGVKALLNFTNTDIMTARGGFVENMQIYDSLMRLNYYIENLG